MSRLSVTTRPYRFELEGQPHDQHDARWENVDESAKQSLLLEYYEVLRRGRNTILLLGLLGAVLGFGTAVFRLPIYRARTSLDIQNLNDNFLGRRNISLTSDGSESNDEYRVQTQIKLLQSDTLLERTVNRLLRGGRGDLSIPRDDLMSQWRRSFHLPESSRISGEELVKYAAKHLTIKPLGVTRLVEITCESYDPKFSVEFCNAMTAEYAAQDREVRMSEAQKTSEYLSRQLVDVRESVAGSERKLEVATGHDGLKLSQAGSTVAEQRLADLQSELMKAQADRIEKQAQYENSMSAPPDSLPVVLDSAAYRDQQTRLADLRHQVAMLVPPLTEENPRVQHLRAQIAEAEAAELTVKRNVISRLANEYQAACHRETMLQTAYEEQQRKVSIEMNRQNQVSMLRHEVESGQQLYQTLLQRVKEAGFAAAMGASTVRVVDAAAFSPIPIAPRYPAAIATGLLLGLIFGTGRAFVKERTQTMLRAPGDVPRYLRLKELGVIPSVRPSMRVFPLRDRDTHVSHSTTLLSLNSGVETKQDSSSSRTNLTVTQSRSSLMAEAFRNATYSVLRASKVGRPSKIYVVSSPGVGDGKTTVTCNLGIALAQANKRVLLIDGDLRRPKLHELAHLENKYGLRELLQTPIESLPPSAQFCQATSIDGLFLLPTGKGRGEPASLLHSSAMAALLKRLSADFDIILVDSPPAIHIADARILAGLSDGVILVFRASTTARDTAMSVRDLFLDDEVEVVGTILNDFDPAREGISRYYNSYYAYSGDDQTPNVRKASASL